MTKHPNGKPHQYTDPDKLPFRTPDGKVRKPHETREDYQASLFPPQVEKVLLASTSLDCQLGRTEDFLAGPVHIFCPTILRGGRVQKERCMRARKKSVWKEHLPIHLLFSIVALIGFWKASTLWGFAILGASIGFTGIVSVFEKKQLLRIEQRPDVSPRMQLESLGSDNATLDRLEQEWMFVASSFCVNPQKIRLDDSVYLLSKFDSLGGDASIELDVRLNRDKPLDPSCTLKELIFLLDDPARRANHG